MGAGNGEDFATSTKSVNKILIWKDAGHPCFLAYRHTGCLMVARSALEMLEVSSKHPRRRPNSLGS